MRCVCKPPYHNHRSIFKFSYSIRNASAYDEEARATARRMDPIRVHPGTITNLESTRTCGVKVTVYLLGIDSIPIDIKIV